MRIVLFTRRHAPSVGGVEKYIQRLAQALIRLGHDPLVITGAHQAGLPPRELIDSVPVHRFCAYRSPLRARASLMRMASLIRQADVIHVSDTAMLEYYHRMIAWRFADKPLFLTRHGMSYIHPVPEREKARARRTLGWVDGVVHDGLFIEKWLGVAPDITPDQGLWPEARDVRQIPEPPPDSAIFVGRLDRDSGIWIYLKAVHQLKQCHNMTLNLDVYGDGDQRDALERFARENHLAVTFHGWRADAQERITDGAFAFLDGRMAMQEAMARKRLVVAAYVDPLKRDYVTGEPFSPYLLAGGDPETIAKHVLHFSRDHAARRKLVEQAFAHALTLSWRKTALAYCDLWRTAPRRRRRKQSLISRMILARSLAREGRRPDIAAGVV